VQPLALEQMTNNSRLSRSRAAAFKIKWQQIIACYSIFKDSHCKNRIWNLHNKKREE